MTPVSEIANDDINNDISDKILIQFGANQPFESLERLASLQVSEFLDNLAPIEDIDLTRRVIQEALASLIAEKHNNLIDPKESIEESNKLALDLLEFDVIFEELAAD